MPNGKPNIFVIWDDDIGSSNLSCYGRAVDERETSDMGPYIRNSVTNAAVFGQVFRRWARASADGLTELKELSPIDPSALQARR